MGIFPSALQQVTPRSLVRSGRISNSSEMFWLFSLPANMKKIRSKMKVLECSQDFPVGCHGNQIPIRSGPKPDAAFSPPQ